MSKENSKPYVSIRHHNLINFGNKTIRFALGAMQILRHAMKGLICRAGGGIAR